ncbi:uncharacterized protein LOC122669767 [Telopea speciosissima]|uniref:uncharacterized protein LOC122669767 n=1 Tax=Telopea speciosissima TaxID=54955 RepID=UPI001CC761C7|nr:uncharacterized protein LOC122669767 [Telopea speciosissima]
MAMPDPRKGNIYVWLVSCLYFVSIVTGGVFLLVYIGLPETSTTHWFPVIGVVLVGIPWFCWGLTILYRCITPRGDSPARAGGGGGGGRGGGGGANKPGISNVDVCVATTSGNASSSSPVGSPVEGTRQVRFGTTIVVDEERGHGASDQKRNDEEDHRTSSSSSSSNDNILLLHMKVKFH